MKDFRNFVLDKCILYFDAEQVYLKPQVTNLKNKEVAANPRIFSSSKTLYPLPFTLYPEHQICTKP